MQEPKVSRPFINADYGVPKNMQDVLPWDYVVERLEQARNYWIATVGPENRPHVMPVWGVFVDGHVYFDGSPQTRRGRNIAANPNVVVHLESGDQVVVVEGQARQISGIERSTAERIAASYREKYAASGYSPQPDQWEAGGLYRVDIHKVLAWTKFPDTMTRWVFDK